MLRVQKGTISVQPESVKRRKKSSSKGRKVLPQGKVSHIIPQKVINRKREHKLSKNVIQNEPPAKKHSKTMLSTSRNTVIINKPKAGAKKEN